MSLVIQEERLDDRFFDESMPIMLSHWNEVAVHKDIPLSPNRELYIKLDEAGCILNMTARKDGKLIGYIIFSISPNMHYQTSLQASQDAFFVDKGSRKTMAGVGISLLKESEKILASKGVQVITQHVKIYKDFSPMLLKFGYKHIENIYQKRLY